RQPRHHRIQPRARRQAGQDGEGLPGNAGNRRRPHLHHQLRQGAAPLPRRERDLLGAQPAGARGRPRPVTARFGRASLLLLPALAGCATHADLVQQERQVRGLIQENRRQIEQLQREVERLRADVEEGGGHKHGAAGDDRLNALEPPIAALEHGAPPPTSAPTEAQPVSPPPTTPPPAVAAKPAPAATEDDEWRREVAREQSTAGTVNVPERPEYLTILDGLAR